MPVYEFHLPAERYDESGFPHDAAMLVRVEARDAAQGYAAVTKWFTDPVDEDGLGDVITGPVTWRELRGHMLLPHWCAECFQTPRNGHAATCTLGGNTSDMEEWGRRA